MPKCLPGCTCKRHSPTPRRCQTDCTCAKHSLTEERRKNISRGLLERPPSQKKREFLQRATPQLCACGCGEYAAVDERRNRVSKYVSGHNSRSAHPMAGKQHTAETRAAIAEATRQQMARQHPVQHRPQDHRGTHNSWRWMMSRCFDSWNASYPTYGARGITVCQRWLSFDNFVTDMGERPQGTTLDRIDNDGNYEPGNARWATPKEQRANQKPRGPYKKRGGA